MCGTIAKLEGNLCDLPNVCSFRFASTRVSHSRSHDSAVLVIVCTLDTSTSAQKRLSAAFLSPFFSTKHVPMWSVARIFRLTCLDSRVDKSIVWTYHLCMLFIECLGSTHGWLFTMRYGTISKWISCNRVYWLSSWTICFDHRFYRMCRMWRFSISGARRHFFA